MKNVALLICALVFAGYIDAQIITTIAGSGPWFGPGHGAFSGDSGQATNAQFFQPVSLAIDSIGNIYIADGSNLRIRKINTSGIINTIAGTGAYGYGGDDSLATGAKFCDFGYITLGPDNCLYIPDICNNRIRKIDLATNIITTVAGNGLPYCNRDTGIATNAIFNYPFSVNFDKHRNLYFLDACNYIEKVNSTGAITRFAGIDSTNGYSGDNGSALLANLSHPIDATFDFNGNLYFGDVGNNVIRKIDTFGIITTCAGSSIWGFSGDNGPATLAQFRGIEGIATDGAGNVFFADELNDVIRKVDHATGIISTIAGNGTFGYSGDGFAATNAQLYHPTGIAFDTEGNLYIADWYNNRIRKVTNVGVPLKVRGALQQKATEVYIYPNPANKFIYINATLGAEVILTNLLGQIHMETTMRNSIEQIDVSGFTNGVYLVAVTNPETGLKSVMLKTYLIIVIYKILSRFLLD